MKTIRNILLSSATGICLGYAALCSGQTTNLLYAPPPNPDSGGYPAGRDNYNGAIARSARSLGMPAPVNEALTTLTQELAQDPDRRDNFRGNKQALMAYLEGHGINV